MKKLSPAQQHVVDRMKEGWELVTESRQVYAHGGDTVITLRLAGRPYQRVRYATFDHLRHYGYIAWLDGDGHGTTYYKLSEEV